MIHETHGRHGQEEERLQLVVCCRTRGKIERLRSGEQKEWRRSVGNPTVFVCLFVFVAVVGMTHGWTGGVHLRFRVGHSYESEERGQEGMVWGSTGDGGGQEGSETSASVLLQHQGGD